MKNIFRFIQLIILTIFLISCGGKEEKVSVFGYGRRGGNRRHASRSASHAIALHLPSHRLSCCAILELAKDICSSKASDDLLREIRNTATRAYSRHARNLCTTAGDRPISSVLCESISSHICGARRSTASERRRR